MKNLQLSQTPRRKTKTKTEIVASTSLNGVNALSSSAFVVNFKIPLIIPPTTHQFCHVVIVSYNFKIEAKADGFMSGNFGCAIPIIIGSPIVGNVQQPVANMPPMQNPNETMPMLYVNPVAPYMDDLVRESDLRKLVISNKSLITLKFEFQYSTTII